MERVKSASNRRMAYASPEEMIFGSAVRPLQTRRGLGIGMGQVIPEFVSQPRPGRERDLKSLLREFERATEDALQRCIFLGHPSLVVEIEHVSQMTRTPDWGREIAAQTASQLDEYHAKYGLRCAHRLTVADIRKPDCVHLRSSDQTDLLLQAFEACSEHADIVSIESLGGKEVFDHCLIREDIVGLLFAQAVLGGRDLQWLWPRITEIALRHGAIPGGDTDCAQANTAMYLAGGHTPGDIPHTLAALCRAIGAARTLVAYECGALGPGKDCAYENPIIKAITGITISTEGKSSACAHPDLCGNVMAAVCDLWSNEAVEYHEMFGGTTPAVFTEILGYDVAAMNAALELGHQRAYQACLVHSDRYRNVHGFILCPDNAHAIGEAIVKNDTSYYSRARAAALTCAELIRGDPRLRMTEHEARSLDKYVKILDDLPPDEQNFIDMCLNRYRSLKGFRPDSYGF